jgi:hypothetical protein
MKVVRHVTRGAPGREAAGMKIALDPYTLRRVLSAWPGCRSARYLAKYGGAG